MGAVLPPAHSAMFRDLVNITWDTNSGPAISAPGDDHQQGFRTRSEPCPHQACPSKDAPNRNQVKSRASHVSRACLFCVKSPARPVGPQLPLSPSSSANDICMATRGIPLDAIAATLEKTTPSALWSG